MSPTPKPTNVAAGPLEQALEAAVQGRVTVARLLPTGYARASKQATRLKATPEDVALVGTWLAGWWSQDAITLLDVLNRWDTWLPKARAHEAHLGQGTRKTGGPAQAGRSRPGFR